VTDPACILCGAPPPLTGEHLWPDWYNRQQSESYTYELETIIQDDMPQYAPKDALDLKPEVLCAECNNEWGSRLETVLARILGPMARGEAGRLDRQQQQLVAAWFYLKAMVAEHLVPPERRRRRFFELEQRRRRFQLHVVPTSAIWLRAVAEILGRIQEAGNDRFQALPSAPLLIGAIERYFEEGRGGRESFAWMRP
jgi:hypothetical protein